MIPEGKEEEMGNKKTAKMSGGFIAPDDDVWLVIIPSEGSSLHHLIEEAYLPDIELELLGGPYPFSWTWDFFRGTSAENSRSEKYYLAESEDMARDILFSHFPELLAEPLPKK